MTKNDRVLLHCVLISEIGPAAVYTLLQDSLLKNDLSVLYTASLKDFTHRWGLSERIARIFIDGLRDMRILEKELELLEENPSLTWISCLSDQYPALLKEIHQPPIGFYYQGSLISLASECLAIVGARKASHYARRVIDQLVPDLLARNWTIVSGGAWGVDSMAHQKVVQEAGATVAILGSGLLRLYPQENIPLFEAIIRAGGALISPFTLQTPPIPANFPARNRIISGLSRGCLVVQAAQKSGALITAHYALEQGREVFAVPGPIDDPLSVGCHNLIAQGAKLVGSAEAIFEEFGESIACKPVQNSIFDALPSDSLLSYCDRPVGIEELSKLSGMGYQELQTKLFGLQMEGMVSQNFAGLWQRL
ncbi:MAG: DNA-processing protein DprA [Candidatus Babeliales bacterium]